MKAEKMSGQTDDVPIGITGILCEMVETKSYSTCLVDIRTVLIHLRQKLYWSRRSMADFLGISENVLRAWESGARQPSGAARRLIWVTDLMIRDLLRLMKDEPDKLNDEFNFAFWGKSVDGLIASKKLAEVWRPMRNQAG